MFLPGGLTSIAYPIDGMGRRVGRAKKNLLTVVSDRRYLLGEGNRVLAEYNVDSNNTITDQLGSVRLVVNVNAASASASIVQQINYDAWGVPTIVSGSTFDQPFGFAGGLWDRDTGLVHFGAREYDPYTGRWLQKEPLGFAAVGASRMWGMIRSSPSGYRLSVPAATRQTYTLMRGMIR